MVTNLTRDETYVVKIKAEIIEMPEEIVLPPSLPVEEKTKIEIDLDMMIIIVSCSLGFVLGVILAVKVVQRRRRKRAVMPDGGTKRGHRIKSDLESGKTGTHPGGAGGWDDVMSRNKDSDIFDDFGELASEYQRWMAQEDMSSSKVDATKAEKLAALHKLSVKYDALEEDKKNLEGVPLATLNMSASDLEKRNKYASGGKPKKSANGLVVPRAPAGILPPETSYPKPPIDSPVGYDLTPHKKQGKVASKDPRLGAQKQGSDMDEAVSPSLIESQFLDMVVEDGDVEVDVNPLAAIQKRGMLPGKLSPLDLAPPGALDRAQGSASGSGLGVAPPRPPPGSGITPPASPSPGQIAGQRRPPPPPPGEPSAPALALDLKEKGKVVVKKVQGAPKNKLQKMKSRKKK